MNVPSPVPGAPRHRARRSLPWLGWFVLLALAAPAGAFPGMPGGVPAAEPERKPTPQDRRPGLGAWQRLLDRYLVVTSAKGAPLETRFDYARLAAAKDRDTSLARTRRELLAVPPWQMNGRWRLAWAIDLYNFLVVEQVTLHLHGPDGAPIASVKDLDQPGAPFLRRLVVDLAGRRYSLGTFEQVFVFPRREARDSTFDVVLDYRAHFALVLAAAGGPALQPRAYTADGLDAQLDQAVRQTLASPRHLHWDDTAGVLEASAIFDWYAQDFGPPEQQVEFIRRHAAPTLAAQLAARDVRQIGRYLPWDWSLNQAP